MEESQGGNNKEKTLVMILGWKCGRKKGSFSFLVLICASPWVFMGIFLLLHFYLYSFLPFLFFFSFLLCFNSLPVTSHLVLGVQGPQSNN